MKIKTEIYENGEFKREVEKYLAACPRVNGRPTCKTCGTVIKTGYANAFPVDNDGVVLDTTPQPLKTPYCEKCDPPDGFNYTYATRVFIRNWT